MIRQAATAIALAALLGGCAGTNNPNFAFADFAYYGNNYDEFPLYVMKPGLTRQELANTVKGGLKQIAPDSDVWVAYRFPAVMGPDYVSERLFVKVSGDRVIGYTVVKGGDLSQDADPGNYTALEPAPAPAKPAPKRRS